MTGTRKMASRFIEFFAITVYLFLEWKNQMSRAMGGWLVIVGLLMALFFIAAATGVQSDDISQDAQTDAAKAICAVGAITGMVLFVAGASRYSKK
jgi:hypothetical protein